MAKEVAAQIPKKLNKEPLLEAIWELRFDGNPAAGTALLGLLFKKYAIDGREVKIQTLPLASVPPEARNSQEPLRYLATSILRMENYGALIGDHAVALSVTKPYPGWTALRKKILELAKWLQQSQLIGQPQQCTLRYIDFFPQLEIEPLRSLRLEIHAAGMQPGAGELKLQMPVKKGIFDGVIQIMNPATVTVMNKQERGLVTDVQVTWHNKASVNFWKAFPSVLDKAKSACHQLFFGLLTEKTVKYHDPVY